MPSRYLFGPVARDFAEKNLGSERQPGNCLVFDRSGAGDLRLTSEDSWESLRARLPPDWEPDFIVLYLAYTTIPEWLWSAPVPLVGLAPDHNLLWHQYRQQLPRCDLVLTDTPGVGRLRREGIEHAQAANLFGYQPQLWENVPVDGPRDIDILFVGNLQPAVQRERLPWLARLARLGERWRVAIDSGVYEDAYRALLSRARIIFNRSVRGECNCRALEAVAAGALLFQEQENLEVPAYFRDRQECVFYTVDNLEELLEYYLEHEDERHGIAEAGRAKVRQYSFPCLWKDQLHRIEKAWPELVARARSRPTFSDTKKLISRVSQAQGSTSGAEPTLLADLVQALATEPQSADLNHTLGLAIPLAARDSGPGTFKAAAEHFRRALAACPTDVLAGLNLAEALAAAGEQPAAVNEARRALAVLDESRSIGPQLVARGHLSAGFDFFRVEWEQAAWANAGQPAREAEVKQDLLRWRLHALLAELTGDLGHAYEAVLARPDLAVTQAKLGAALYRSGRLPEATAHLRRALAANPFDRDTARLLYEGLGTTGDVEGQRRLAEERRLLAQAAPKIVPLEPWSMSPRPIGDELASIIILCCNQVEYTRLCLESVIQHTRSPYELVLVDNGSTDETPAYLEEIRHRSGPARVEIIRNETNYGFPAGCNQALARARGRYLVFLNNDTVVTDRWLDGLVAWALHDWPKVGLVGAVTNYAAPPQQIGVDYTDLAELPAFAARRSQAYARRAIKVERLTGFCLLVRREVLDKIGGFDEQYQLGFFDDDDLCVRARESGFQLLVALNVHIHHFGSLTFNSLGIDCRKQLVTNFERFKAKWGPERAAGYRLPEVGSSSWPVIDSEDQASEVRSPTADDGRRTVSLCLIVKNEEANLPACLESAAGLCDEIIVVDTGSTDRTREIALEHGARVFDFPWCDSFAAARNECLCHATGEWIFWLDADDRLDEANRQKLCKLFATLADENVAYSMKCLCLPDPVSHTATAVDHIRLFRSHPDIRWQYRVHEQILPAIRQRGGAVRWSEVVIRHTGYQDPAFRRQKLDRDLRLLRLDHEEHPEDPFILFNLGSVYHELGKIQDALPFLQGSLERSHPVDSIVRKLFALIVQCHRQLAESEAALATCRAGRRHYPEDAELLFQEGLLRREQADRAGAKACFRRLLESREAAHFASVDVGLHGYKARHNLAVIALEENQHAEAEAHWQAALREHPQFVPACIGLGEILLAQNRFEELTQVVQHLESDLSAPIDAAVLRSRAHLAQREFAAARRILEEIIGRAPEAVWPRVILTHVFLQEGTNWAAAERALRAVLALDPNHVEARQNLVVLLRQTRRNLEDSPAKCETLAELYDSACRTPSDINEHCPTLHALAQECRHITEMGTREGVSTSAFLFAQPDKLVCYDALRYPQIDALHALAGRTEFVFQKANVLQATIEETDLLFIDTWHVYDQLREELRLHSGKVRKYIVLHDTNTFGQVGETEGHAGLWPAVEEFLAQGSFRLKHRFENNNGLAILERATDLAEPIPDVIAGKE
jgi:GT2 family glycosyltransferase/tetratricopeptide (TPR) repeat protein